MKNIIANIFQSIGTVLMLPMSFLSLFLHFYTAYYAYKVSGLLAAVITLLLAGFSEVYWFFHSLISKGVFWNSYNKLIVIYICYFIVGFGMTLIASHLKDNK